MKKKIRVFDIINIAMLCLFCLICIYPFIFVLAGSFSQGSTYYDGGVWLIPRNATLANFKVILNDQRLIMAFTNTVIRSVVTPALALFFTSFCAYGLHRKNLKFRKIFWWINLITMFFSGGLIPYFLIIVTLGLYNSYLVYIIPGIYSVYNMIIISNFFNGISDELHEAALIDGASEFRIWLTIYMPLSKAVLATVALWLVVGNWNSYLPTLLYTTDEKLITLQFYVMKIIQGADPKWTESTLQLKQLVSDRTLSFAAIILATLPVLCVYPFVQKFFQSGIMIGSVKG